MIVSEYPHNLQQKIILDSYLVKELKKISDKTLLVTC